MNRLRGIGRSPLTWWFIALAGLFLIVLAVGLVLAGVWGAAFTCSLPHACAEGGGLPFFLDVDVVLWGGVALLVGGGVGHVLARRSDERSSSARAHPGRANAARRDRG